MQKNSTHVNKIIIWSKRKEKSRGQRNIVKRLCLWLPCTCCKFKLNTEFIFFTFLYFTFYNINQRYPFIRCWYTTLNSSNQKQWRSPIFHSFVLLFARSLTRSFIHPSIHLFIHSILLKWGGFALVQYCIVCLLTIHDGTKSYGYIISIRIQTKQNKGTI